MEVIYLKEVKKPKGFLKRVIIKIRLIFNKIDIINKDGKRYYYLPIDNKKNTTHKIRKITYKILTNFYKDGANIVVLSNYLSNNVVLKNELYSNNVIILDGRYLFKYLYKEIIEYILSFKKEKIENSEVFILINDLTQTNKKVLIDIAKSVKALNIVTNNINKFKRLEKHLYNEYGILLNISNNKRTSLLKSKIILNLDFPEEIINRYRINTNAVIVNLLQKIEIRSKKFNGININYFKIKIPDAYKIEGFSNEKIYESIIYNLDFNTIKERIKKDKIYIEGLIGNNGIISKQEFIKN